MTKCLLVNVVADIRYLTKIITKDINLNIKRVTAIERDTENLMMSRVHFGKGSIKQNAVGSGQDILYPMVILKIRGKHKKGIHVDDICRHSKGEVPSFECLQNL